MHDNRIVVELIVTGECNNGTPLGGPAHAVITECNYIITHSSNWKNVEFVFSE